MIWNPPLSLDKIYTLGSCIILELRKFGYDVTQIQESEDMLDLSQVFTLIKHGKSHIETLSGAEIIYLGGASSI